MLKKGFDIKLESFENDRDIESEIVLKDGDRLSVGPHKEGYPVLCCSDSKEAILNMLLYICTKDKINIKLIGRKDGRTIYEASN